MSKVSWLDSIGNQSNVHIDDGTGITLCGYHWKAMTAKREPISNAPWKLYRVALRPNHPRRCMTCFTKALRLGISITEWHPDIPERDITALPPQF